MIRLIVAVTAVMVFATWKRKRKPSATEPLTLHEERELRVALRGWRWKLRAAAWKN